MKLSAHVFLSIMKLVGKDSRIDITIFTPLFALVP